jgi:serine protease Do
MRVIDFESTRTGLTGSAIQRDPGGRNPGTSFARSVTRVCLGLVLSTGLLIAPVLVPPAQAQRGAPESFAPLAERILPAVVNISTTQTVEPKANGRQAIPLPEFPPGSPFEEFFRDYFERQQRDPNAPPRRANSLGSGFIIDSTGYVVTNNHVIEGADEIRVILQDEDNTELKATLIGVDTETDLALLKVEAGRKLPSLNWGDSDSAKVGDWAVAIGNPFGLGGTVTAGIVSARGRFIGAGNYDDFIQTDASINQGNSGGPLVNLQGEVIGINTAIFSRTGGSVGIGFAIPSAMARNVVAQLRDGGKVRRGWLGVQIEPVTPDKATALGLKEARGALVAVVNKDTPAAEAGVKPGDVIISFDGRDIHSSRNLPRMVAETGVGKSVSLGLVRRGERLTVQVKLGELPVQRQDAAAAGEAESKPAASDSKTIDKVGLTVSTLTPELRQQLGLAEKSRGVVVTRVAKDSPAASRGIRPGDIIVDVSQEAVSSPADVATKVGKAVADNQRALLLLVDRKGELLFLAVSLTEP